MIKFISLLTCSWATFICFQSFSHSYLINFIIILSFISFFTFSLQKLEKIKIDDLKKKHLIETTKLKREIIEIKKEGVL